MLIRTNFVFDNWLTHLFRDITRPLLSLNTTTSSTYVDFGLRSGKLNACTSVTEALGKGDRRKPAYAQLRHAWDKLDRLSQQEALDWILQRTMIDPLSGLETLAAKEVSGQKPEGWVEAISDLNALKAINDTWGHAAGDTIIRELGSIVKAEVIKAGGRAFRIGGDEIGYWFPDTSAAKCALERIDARFQAEAFVIGGQKRKGFSISYGIGPDFLSADHALYQDKEKRIELGQRSEHGQIPQSIAVYA